MTSTVQIVDPDDLATVLFDLNDQTGATTGDYGSVQTFLLSDPAWGAPTYTFDRFQAPDGTGGQTAFSRANLTDCTIHIRIKATTYDNLATAIGRLSGYLAQGCVMKWIPQGSANTRFIDLEPSMTPALFSGRALGLYEVVRLFDTPAGVMLSLTRQPFMRGPELSADTNIITSNTTLLLDKTAGDFQPDGWVLDTTTSVVDNGVSDTQEAFSLSLPQSVTRNLSRSTVAASVGNSQTWTFSYYAKVAATGGGVATLTASAAFQPQTSAPASNGAEIVGSGVVLTTSWQRITGTGTTPGSSNDRAKLFIRAVTGAGTSPTVFWRWAQFEQAAAASPFRVGAELVKNDPTALGAARMLPFVNVGDAPAPVRVTAIGTSSIFTHYFAALTGELPGKGSVNYLHTTATRLLEAESLTPHTDTATFADGINASGASNNTMKTTFATATHINRFDGTYTSNVATSGRTYRIFLRARADGTTSSFTVALQYGMSGAGLTVTNSTITFTPTVTNYYDIDLGLVSFPKLPGGTAPNQLLAIFAGRTTGSANLMSDFLWFVPATGASLVSSSVAGDSAVTKAVYTMPDLGKVQVGDPAVVVPSVAGSIPFMNLGTGLSVIAMRPGNVSAAWGVRQDDISTNYQSTVKFTYSPRYFG